MRSENGVLRDIYDEDILEDGSFIIPVANIKEKAFGGCGSLKEFREFKSNKST